MYKVERKPANPKAMWYEVMLSPFDTQKEAEEYVQKYKIYYPVGDQQYRIIATT
jgi:hypothetical protein